MEKLDVVSYLGLKRDFILPFYHVLSIAAWCLTLKVDSQRFKNLSLNFYIFHSTLRRYISRTADDKIHAT